MITECVGIAGRKVAVLWRIGGGMIEAVIEVGARHRGSSWLYSERRGSLPDKDCASQDLLEDIAGFVFSEEMRF
jgi:hypothetical protein